MQHKNYLLLFLIACLFVSCTKKLTNSSLPINKVNNNKIDLVLNQAKTYLTTSYQYGGSTKSGIDCSGLVYNSFKYINVLLPKNSEKMALLGVEIQKNELKVADLLFFETNGKNISHVAIVEKVERGEVFFIHATTSKGVIISSMNEKYWKNNFVLAKRIIF